MAKDKDKERPKRPTHKFYLPVETAYELYWEWRNSDYKTLPEAGGLLDQDPLVMSDLYAIGAWLDFVEYDIRHPEQTLLPVEAESAISFRELAG